MSTPTLFEALQYAIRAISGGEIKGTGRQTTYTQTFGQAFLDYLESSVTANQPTTMKRSNAMDHEEMMRHFIHRLHDLALHQAKTEFETAKENCMGGSVVATEQEQAIAKAMYFGREAFVYERAEEVFKGMVDCIATGALNTAVAIEQQKRRERLEAEKRRQQRFEPAQEAQPAKAEPEVTCVPSNTANAGEAQCKD